MNRMASGPRTLTVKEKQDLRRDMAESSVWARAELKYVRIRMKALLHMGGLLGMSILIHGR